MEILNNFLKDEVCPVCMTADDEPFVLVGIKNKAEPLALTKRALPVHVKCMEFTIGEVPGEALDDLYFASMVFRSEHPVLSEVTKRGMAKKFCEGCYNNIYNGEKAEECWCYKTAKMVMRKKVPLDQRPPWTQDPIPVPDCYKETGFVFTDPYREN